ncbi:MAG: TPM domain-containing protein [Desulfatitalea sp.]
MKHLARRFLSDQEREQIDAAVRAAEKQTAGEIVCLIMASSYRYPMANVIGATVLGLPLALVLTHWIGAHYWIGTQNMWLFIGLFGVLFTAIYLLVDHTPWLKRRFISRLEIEEEVHEAAVTAFFNHGLYRTRDATGILVFVSVLEHKVWILADHGINAKVPAGHWDALVASITAGIRQKQAAAAICTAVASIGAILESHFPIRADDRDELKSVIVGDGG